MVVVAVVIIAESMKIISMASNMIRIILMLKTIHILKTIATIMILVTILKPLRMQGFRKAIAQ
jgi:hypothetical protein